MRFEVDQIYTLQELPKTEGTLEIQDRNSNWITLEVLFPSDFLSQSQQIL